MFREEKVQELMQKMGRQQPQASAPDDKERRIQELMAKMEAQRQPQQAAVQSTFTPEEVQHYQGILNQPPSERPNVRPKQAALIAANMRQQHPELKDFSNDQIMDVYYEMRRHKVRHFGESLTKGIIGTADIPQYLRHLATKVTPFVETYNPEEYPSQAIQRFLKEKNIVDLNKERALTPSEKITGTAAEWVGGALGPAGIGKTALGALTPLAQVTKGIPYAGKVARGLEKGTEIVYGVPKNAAELAKYTAIAGGLGATSGALQSYAGLSPEQASMIGLVPLAGGIAKSVANIPRAAKSINPLSEREALADYLQKTEATAARQQAVKASTPKMLSELPAESLGQNVRKEIQQKQKILEAERKQISGPEYEQLQHIKEIPKLERSFNYLKEYILKVDLNDKSLKAVNFISNNLSGPNNAPLNAAQLEKKLRLFNSNKSKAFKSEDFDTYHLYKETLSHLDDDLKTIPEIKKIRKQYAELSTPIQEIKKKYKSILKKDDFLKQHTVLDSEVPSKLINLTPKGISSQKNLKKIIGNDESISDQIKAYNFKKLYDSVSDSAGNINNEKLIEFKNNNPGLFIWDPSLRNKLANVEKAQKYVDSIDLKIKEKLSKSVSLQDVMKNVTGHDALAAALGFYLTHSVTGATIGAIPFAHRQIKSHVYKSKMKSLLEKD